jgi:transcriptional regulator with XRE-family HTH domain
MANGKQFGRRLRELRLAAGLTQEQLGEKRGLSLGGVRDLEQGRNQPSWETVLALAAALGVDCRAFTVAPGKATRARGRGRPKGGASG